MSDVLNFYRAMSAKKPAIDQAWFAESRGDDPLVKTPTGIYLASLTAPSSFNRLIGICRFLANRFDDEMWSDAVVWVDLDWAHETDRVCVLHEMLGIGPFGHILDLDFNGRRLLVSSCEYEDKEVIS